MLSLKERRNPLLKGTERPRLSDKNNEGFRGSKEKGFNQQPDANGNLKCFFFDRVQICLATEILLHDIT